MPLWVGGLWLWQFVMLPAIAQTGLAPLLVQEIADHILPLLIALAGLCVGVQVLALLRCEGLAGLWKDLRGQLLLTVVIMSLGNWLAQHQEWDAVYWQRFSYLVMAFSGLLLVLQPVPGKRQP